MSATISPPAPGEITDRDHRAWAVRAVFLLVVGTVLTSIGTFATWLNVTGPSGGVIASTGMQDGRHGRFIFGLAIVVLVCGIGRLVVRGVPRWFDWVSVALAAALVWFSVANTLDTKKDVVDIRRLTPLVQAHVGWGLIAAMIGSSLALIGSIFALDLRRG